ncbi:hypothetical protein DFH09DRAFT_1424094 [Mycena vulgaris]|nr:hypothetical protein DFH09DRAFT_1424094 [Mycena vulgaris]
MFFPAAPVTVRDVVPQACTLPFGGGVCTPLNGTSCTNTPGIQSLILNLDADCAAFPLPDCEVGQGALEQFSDDSQHLEGKGIQSVQCFENVGTVNGATAGSPEDIAQEAADADEAEGIVRIPPPNCADRRYRDTHCSLWTALRFRHRYPSISTDAPRTPPAARCPVLPRPVTSLPPPCPVAAPPCPVVVHVAPPAPAHLRPPLKILPTAVDFRLVKNSSSPCTFAVLAAAGAWELILNELPDQSLLIAARVCRAFNDRCIVLYFARHEIPVQSLTGDFLKIDAHLLRALQVQRLRPRLSTLICRFWPFYVLRDMKLLLELIKKSPGLAELRLSFSEDLLTAHTLDTIFPYSQHTLVDAFCDVIRAMAAKTEAPVVLIVFGRIYYLRPAISRAGDCATSPPGNISSGRLLGLTEPTFGGKGRAPSLSRWLRKPPPSLFCNGPVPGSQLTRILPLLTLPSLRTLALNADVDPAVLGQFLIRHPTITVIHPWRFGAYHSLLLRRRKDHPPPEHVLALAPAVYNWNRVRARYTDMYRVPQARPARLSLHPRPVCLRICKWRADALAIDAEERQIVGCLYAVDSMHVDARGAAELLALLPWVEMLPALRRLEVMIYVDEQARRVSLLPEVRAALPWVPDVMILPW